MFITLIYLLWLYATNKALDKKEDLEHNIKRLPTASMFKDDFLCLDLTQ